MKQVVFMHRYGPTLASFRYRTEMPVNYLNRHGFDAQVNDGAADILVLSKPSADDLTLAHAARAEGCKVVMDICDDHFNTKALGPLYRDLSGLADHIVCASNIMRNRITEYTGKTPTVIEDPYEQPELEPHAVGDSLLWFGHQRNLPELESVSHFLQDRKVYVVTGPKPVPNTIQWTPDVMKRAFAASNTAIFPVMRGREHRSPNRLVNALRAGCWAVCMGHPAFEAFRKFVWVGNFPTGLRFMDANQHIVNELVAEGQEFVRDRYSPDTIGAQWANLLDSI